MTWVEFWATLCDVWWSRESLEEALGAALSLIPGTLAPCPPLTWVSIFRKLGTLVRKVYFNHRLYRLYTSVLTDHEVQFNYFVCFDCGWVVLAPAWTSRRRKPRGLPANNGHSSQWMNKKWYLRERKQGDLGREGAKREKRNGGQGREGREPWCLGAQCCRKHGNHRKKVAHAIVGSSCGLVLLRRQGRDSSPLSDWITRQGTLHFWEAAGAVTLPPVNSGPVKRAQMSGIWELNLPSGCSLPSRLQSLLTGWNVHSCICCVVCQDSPWLSVIFQLHDACWEFSALKIHHSRAVIAFKFIFKDDNTLWYFCCCLINHIAG